MTFFSFSVFLRFIKCTDVFKESILCFVDFSLLFCFQVHWFLLLSLSPSFCLLWVYAITFKLLRWNIGFIWDSFSFQVYASSAINFPLSTILGSAQTKGRITQVTLHLTSPIEQWFRRQWLKPGTFLSDYRVWVLASVLRSLG